MPVIFDLCRMNWTADFSDPYTYLSMLLSDVRIIAVGSKNEQYDELVRDRIPKQIL